MKNTSKRGCAPFGVIRRRRCLHIERLEMCAVPALFLAPPVVSFVPTETVEVGDVASPTYLPTVTSPGPSSGVGNGQYVVEEAYAGQRSEFVEQSIELVEPYRPGNSVQTQPPLDPVAQLTVDPRVAASQTALELPSSPIVSQPWYTTGASNGLSSIAPLMVQDDLPSGVGNVLRSGFDDVQAIAGTAKVLGSSQLISPTANWESAELIDSITLDDMIPNHLRTIADIDQKPLVTLWTSAVDATIDWSPLEESLVASLQALHRGSLIRGQNAFFDQVIDLDLLHNANGSTPSFTPTMSDAPGNVTVVPTLGLELPYIVPDEIVDLPDSDSTSTDVTTVDIGGNRLVQREIDIYGTVDSTGAAVSPISLGHSALQAAQSRRDVSLRLVELGFESSDSLTARFRPVELATATPDFEVSGSPATDTTLDQAANESWSTGLDWSETSFRRLITLRPVEQQIETAVVDGDQPIDQGSDIAMTLPIGFDHGRMDGMNARLEADWKEGRGERPTRFGEFSHPAADLFVVVFGCFAASVVTRQLDPTQPDVPNVIRSLF